MQRILSSIFFGVWAIEHGGAMAGFPEVKRLLDGTAPHLTKEQLEAYRASAMPTAMNGDGEMVDVDQPIVEKYVMVMPLRGAILRDDMFCGPIGMETRAKWLRQADSDPNVVGVVLDTDTPGGEGSGMRIFADQLTRMKKPVVTYVNHGYCASAGMGIAAPTREIWLSNPNDMLGSIGTYMTLPDMLKYYAEELNLTVHQVYATLSTQKNLPWKEALKADPSNPDDPHYALLRTELLDPFNESFIAHVKKSRPQAKDAEGVFNGKLFRGDDAIRLGLADRYGTLEEAVQRVIELADADSAEANTSEENNNANPSNQNTKTNEMKNFKTVLNSAVLGFVALFAKDEDATAENIAAANAEMKESGLTNVVLVSTADQALIADAAAQVSAAREEASNATARVTELEQELATATGNNTTAAEALAAAATDAGIELAEGDNALEALTSALATATADLATAQARIAELSAEPVNDGNPAGPLNTKGDVNTPANTNPEVEEFEAGIEAELKARNGEA